MINLFKQIFIWWNRQTIETFIYTLFFGKFVGEDEFGNKYYNSTKGKRWVIYKNEVEASKIPPEWHMWIHFVKNKKPENDIKKFSWQKKHSSNLTGTNKAYKPKGSLSSTLKNKTRHYDTWKN
jgi:NADH dehydrogenase